MLSTATELEIIIRLARRYPDWPMERVITEARSYLETVTYIETVTSTIPQQRKAG